MFHLLLFNKRHCPLGTRSSWSLCLTLFDPLILSRHTPGFDLRCGLRPQVYMAIVLPLLIAYCFFFCQVWTATPGVHGHRPAAPHRLLLFFMSFFLADADYDLKCTLPLFFCLFSVRCGLRPQVYMAIVLPLLIAYCSVKNLKVLSYFSAAANVFCLGGILIILMHLFQVKN